LLYTVTSSEIHPETIFKPVVLANTHREHLKLFEDFDPNCVKDPYD